MEPLIKSFRDFVDREQLFTKADKLLVACSGGLDSTVLAHLLHAEGYDFAIVHINFQLRGEASDGDAVFVEELARTLGARFCCKAVDVKGQAEPGESTQMTARRLRYDWFDEILDEQHYSSLLTAHHLNDNFETFLNNLIRGTGIRGIAGMQPRSVRKAKPLLETTREAINAYARSNNINWREDESNASDDYQRNRIRHRLTPIFHQEFGMSLESWKKTARKLRSAQFFYDLGLQREKKSKWAKQTDGDGTIIDRSSWQDKAALTTFLHEKLSPHRLSDEQLRQLVEVNHPMVMDLEGTIVSVTPPLIRIADGRLTPEARPLDPKKITQYPKLASSPFFGHEIKLTEMEKPNKLDLEGVQFLAPTSLPLHLRPRQKGDRFQPLGMGGKSKKVKDYMIDEKIPVSMRDQIYLLTNDQGEIMAIPGYCIAENFKVLPEHETVLRISWT